MDVLYRVQWQCPYVRQTLFHCLLWLCVAMCGLVLVSLSLFLSMSLPPLWSMPVLSLMIPVYPWLLLASCLPKCIAKSFHNRHTLCLSIYNVLLSVQGCNPLSDSKFPLLFELYCLSFLSRSCIYKLNIGLFHLCLYSELPLSLVLYVFFIGGGKSGRVESGKFL